MNPVRDEPLQVIDGGLTISRSAERAVELALAEIVFEFERMAEAEAIAGADLPIETLGGKEVVQGSGGEDAVDHLICGVTLPDEVGAELLTIFHGNEPPGLVAMEGAAGVGGVLLAMKCWREAGRG